jgi:hypothetical protein
VSTEINDLMAGRTKLCNQFLFQPKSAVICGNS